MDLVDVKYPNPKKLPNFVEREPNRPLPQRLVEIVDEALTAFYASPWTRDRNFWAFKGCKDYWAFSLLGMVCALNGLELLEIPRNEHNVACRAFLHELGFSTYDILAIGEINDHTYDIEVLQIRLERYAETGERMPFPFDDLHEIDLRSKDTWNREPKKPRRR